jgi:hypothetical protein
MKPITPARHTIVDVLFCLAMGAAPAALGFGDLPATLCHGIAIGYFVFAMLTNTPSSPIRIIPFRVHGGAEIVAGLGLLAAPWMFGFADVERAKGLFVGAGIVTFAVFALTRWIEEPKPIRRGHQPA